MFKTWFFHNVVAHPLMGLLSVFGFNKLGEKIHDATVPTDK